MARKATATYQLRVTLRDKPPMVDVPPPTNARLVEIVAAAIREATVFDVNVTATRTDK